MSSILNAPITGGSVHGDAQDNQINGSDFADWLDGGAGADVLVAGAGDDQLQGGWADGADDVLTGGAGFDRFEFQIDPFMGAGFGQDVITDFGEGDMIDVYAWGAGVLDVSLAVVGNDSVLTFGAGTPWASTLTLENYILESWEVMPGGEMFSLYGQAGRQISDDHMVGTEFMDHLDGGYGNDHLEGLGGDDFLWGGQGADTLDGGDGNDVLNSGLDGALDAMTGGAGADVFEFEAGDGTVVITDFDAAEGDTMMFFGVTPDDVANRTMVDIAGGAAVVVNFGSAGTVVFEGMSAADVDEAWQMLC